MHLGRLGWIVIGGIVWMVVGVFLLLMGLYLLVLQPQENTALLLALGLVIGFIKGYFILSNAAEKAVKKVLLFSEPISFLQVYPPVYLCLIASMMLLGMGLKWVEMPYYIRGVVDVAVGFALINASITYFRAAYALKKRS
jgi:hypothetical protein